jgi:hypothetical protein
MALLTVEGKKNGARKASSKQAKQEAIVNQFRKARFPVLIKTI